MWLNIISDGLIALAYLTIPITLIYIARKRKDLPFDWMFVCFGVFILACGTTHFLEIWNIWDPLYRLSGVVKAITALASIGTGALLVKLIPKLLAIPSTATLRAANTALENEVAERSARKRKSASCVRSKMPRPSGLSKGSGCSLKCSHSPATSLTSSTGKGASCLRISRCSTCGASPGAGNRPELPTAELPRRAGRKTVDSDRGGFRHGAERNGRNPLYQSRGAARCLRIHLHAGLHGGRHRRLRRRLYARHHRAKTGGGGVTRKRGGIPRPWPRRCRRSSGSRVRTAGTRISTNAGWITPA